MKSGRSSWLFFVAKRFSRVQKEGSNKMNSYLARAGVALGVMTLIVVMSVMNGFQGYAIDAILELSSFHLQCKVPQKRTSDFETFCRHNEYVKTYSCFFDTQGIATTKQGKNTSPLLLRGLDKDIMQKDEGFKKELDVMSGSFDIEKKNSIVLASTLARNLGATVGQEIDVLSLENDGSQTGLLNGESVFEVTGIFHCGYEDVNETQAFLNIDFFKDKEQEENQQKTICYGLKLKNKSLDSVVSLQLQKAGFDDIGISSWKQRNRSFFGALKIEKNTMLLLVILIFVVCGINIYNFQNKMVFSKRGDIAILSCFGANCNHIMSIFILQATQDGIIGSVIGVILGLFLSINMSKVFVLTSTLTYYAQYIFALLFSPKTAPFVRENTIFLLYSSVPARVQFWEVAFISLFGLLCCSISSFFAARKILTFKMKETLYAS